MKLIVTESYEQSCLKAAEMIGDVIRQNPKAKLGLATGSTPEPIYKNLVKMYEQGGLDFSQVSTVNLDEYWGIDPEHPQSYRYFMNHHLFDHVNIRKEATFVATGKGTPEQAADELEEKVFENGAPAIQLLGIGANGHIAFNEAGPSLRAKSHVETLTESTIQANSRFFDSPEQVPTQAITMGMGDILAAGSIVLVATGASKKEAVQGLLLDDVITTENPSTFLKLHPNTTVIIDRELAQLAGV